MAVKKGVFIEYIKERETPNLSSLLKEKSQYTHNKVFDPAPNSDTKIDNTKINNEKVKNPDENGIQTAYKLDSEPGANGIQTEHKRYTNGIQTVYKLDSEPGTNGIQTVYKTNSKVSLSVLAGAQRKIVLAVYKNCRINASNMTQKLTIEHLISLTGIPRNTIKTSISRLKKKGFMLLSEYKDGRGGWSKYSISKELFNDLLHNENNTFISNNGIQTVYKLDSELDSELGTKASSSSISNNINTTNEKELVVYFEPLGSIGFSETQLNQLLSGNLNSPEVIQDSIHHFAFGLKNNPKVKQYSEPLNVLMGVLRKGQAWIEPNYRSEQEIAQEEFIARKKAEVERMKKLKDEAYSLALDEWKATLSDEEVLAIAPKRRGDITPRPVKLSTYFKANIWPEKKHSFLLD